MRNSILVLLLTCLVSFFSVSVFAQNDTPNFEGYKNSDFVAGEKILFFDNFADNTLNQKPKGWEGSAEVSVNTIEGSSQKWLSVHHGGTFFPMGLGTLPETFTLEFDVAVTPETTNGTLNLNFVRAGENLADPYFNSLTNISLSSTTQIPKKGGVALGWKDADGNDKDVPNREVFFTDWTTNEIPKAKIQVVKNGTKLSIYINQKKIIDNKEIFYPNFKYQLSFDFADYFMPDIQFYFTNLKVATGLPQVKKDLEKGKYITQNILFDSNSDKIKPESYAILNLIAKTLKENPTTNYKIVGHTDSDGDEAKNLELSKRRAAAVKHVLATSFGVDMSNYETDGKGESEPIDKNTTPTGKANNRRVEFVRI